MQKADAWAWVAVFTTGHLRLKNKYKRLGPMLIASFTSIQEVESLDVEHWDIPRMQSTEKTFTILPANLQKYS